MQHDQKQLHEIAQNYPWHTFTVEEIAVLCNVSRDVVTRVRMADDSPFFLNKCRPEWFTEWMRDHPEFQLTKAPATEKEPGCIEDNELGGSSPRILKMAGMKQKKQTPMPASVPKSRS